MNTPQKTLLSFKEIILGRWSAADLVIPNWVILAIIWITIIRSASYGIELFLVVPTNPISPLMAYANVLGISVWGLLMLVAVVILVLGILFRSTGMVVLGALMSVAVWACFALVLGIGALTLGEGGRFVVAALATAVTWGVFFNVQLATIRKQGLTSVKT